MNDKFFDLRKDKQDRMINASLKIFSANAYRHASTDEIVKEAGISKGLLFHYFTNKAGLYGFIYDYGAKYIAMELYQTVRVRETDYFELRRQIEYANLQAMKRYPFMEAFLQRAERETDEEILAVIHDKLAARKEEQRKVLERMDCGLWKSSVDMETCLHIIEYTIQGVKEEYWNQSTIDAEELYASIVRYLKFMKPIFSL